MHRILFALNRKSEIPQSRWKNVARRFLSMETLESRELLSAVPADNFSLLDAEEKITRSGWLVYSVVENETANRNTHITVNGVRLGGDGESSTRVFVRAGDALPEVESSDEIRIESGVLQTIRVEDWTDADFNDLVVEVGFEPLFVGTQALESAVPAPIPAEFRARRSLTGREIWLSRKIRAT